MYVQRHPHLGHYLILIAAAQYQDLQRDYYQKVISGIVFYFDYQE